MCDPHQKRPNIQEQAQNKDPTCLDTTDTPPDLPPISKMTKRLLDNLSTSLSQQQSQNAVSGNPSRLMLLKELGHQLYCWRVKHKYSRQALAQQLNTEADILLSIELGIMQERNLDHSLLFALRTLLNALPNANQFYALINRYLAYFD